MGELEEGSTLTWDNFFDTQGVPKEDRGDFVVAAILKQACEKYGFGATSGKAHAS